MMESELLSFMRQYLKRPRTVEALLPSSKYLVQRMMAKIDFENARYLVEYGPGTGAFTGYLLKARKQDTVVLLFESNKEFYELLQKKFGHEPNLYIIHDSAKSVGQYMETHNIPWIDYAVSSVPLTNMSIHEATSILHQTKKHLIHGGRFVSFQYSLTKQGLFQAYFKKIEVSREMRNLPPAYVICCSCSR